MAKNSAKISVAVPKSKEHRAIYSQVQQWSVTDTEVILSFLRAQPDLADSDGKLGTVGVSWINEATIYLPISQAKQMCEILAKSIDKHFSQQKKSH